MKEIIAKSGKKYQIEVGDFGFNNRNGCWFLTLCIESKNNSFDYNIEAHKGLTNFVDNWNLKDNHKDIQKRLEEIGFNKLEKYLGSNNWNGCKQLEDGNYREILTNNNYN